MGFASGTTPQIPANILLVKNATVIGFSYGYCKGWGGKGTLRATDAAALDLADWVKALKLIEERTVIGKAVLVP